MMVLLYGTCNAFTENREDMVTQLGKTNKYHSSLIGKKVPGLSLLKIDWNCWSLNFSHNTESLFNT